MKNTSKIRAGRKCVFNLHVHLVFITKVRSGVFEKSHYDTMREIFEKVCTDFKAVLAEVDGEDNYVHLLVHYPPKMEVVKLVNSLKGVSSRLLKQRHPELVQKYWEGALWSPSYFAGSCGGAPIEMIKQFIEQQGKILQS